MSFLLFQHPSSLFSLGNPTLSSSGSGRIDTISLVQGLACDQSEHSIPLASVIGSEESM